MILDMIRFLQALLERGDARTDRGVVRPYWENKPRSRSNIFSGECVFSHLVEGVSWEVSNHTKETELFHIEIKHSW